MTFRDSCSFCCIANMLESHQLQVSDREIAIGSDLPYLFRYDAGDDSFVTGAMLQTEEDYNRFLTRYGFRLTDSCVPEEEAAGFLRANAPCMIGLKGERGKHAMVFSEHEDGKYRFLNPHRRDDGEEDWVALTEEELSGRLSPENHIACLEKIKPGSYSEDSRVRRAMELKNETQGVLRTYRERFAAFCGEWRTAGEIAACRDKLFRPVAIDMPVMMELVGEMALAEHLNTLQKQLFQVLRQGDCVPADVVDLGLFDEIIAEYQRVVLAHGQQGISLEVNFRY